jgi:hypothetical protein
MVVVKGRLDPEVGALLMRVVGAGCDALYRDKRGEADGDGRSAEEDPTTPEQRRADAVGLVAERALAAGFGKKCESGGEPRAGGEVGDDAGDDDVGGSGADVGGEGGGPADPSPISGSRAERYQVMLHVDVGTLEEHGDPGQSELEDGTRVSAETSRRVACDSGLVKIAHAADGSVVGAGRRTRTVPPAVRRALEARDRGCRFPGCGLRFTDAHHVKHWADGGETSLRNLVLLCRRHHRAVHEGGARVCIDAGGQVVFFTPRGKTLLGAPPIPETPPGPLPMAERPMGGHSSGERPEEGAGDLWENVGMPPQPGEGNPFDHQPRDRTGASHFKRDADIPWSIEAKAWEALDSG